jgi:archaellum component FlaF (FlaF/FlaG flagellin family)
LLPGETEPILELSSFGTFYSAMTDSVGCVSYSDTLQIENFRDAGVQDIHFDHACATTAISVNVKNFGTQNISSLEFELMVDGVVVGTPVWTGILASGDTLEDFVLATVPHTFGQVHTINVSTELPNNDVDLFSLNDQLSATYHLQQPNFDLGPDTAICIGNSIQLYPSDSLNFSGFNWSTGETNAGILTAQEGLFILEAIDSFGCVRTDSIEVMVGGDIEPVISFSNNTLYSSVNTGNQWHLNTIPIGNATAASFVPTQNGNYTVVYTDEYGCEASSAVYVVSTAGVIENEQIFSIYPNPASDYLKIVSTKTETIDYTITDVSGKLVQAGEISPNAKVISLNNLQSGTYYITLSGSNSTLRFIK